MRLCSGLLIQRRGFFFKRDSPVWRLAYRLHDMPLRSRKRQWIQAYLREKLPGDYGLGFDFRESDDDGRSLWVNWRDRFYHPDVPVWHPDHPDKYLHVVSERISSGPDAVKYVEQFMGIEGEVCVSRPQGDDLIGTNRKKLFGILLYGRPSAVYTADCYSDICPLTGRRVAGDSSGGARIEAWLTPARCVLAGVATDIPEFAVALAAAGITVFHQKRATSIYKWFDDVVLGDYSDQLQAKNDALDEKYKSLGRELESASYNIGRLRKIFGPHGFVEDAEHRYKKAATVLKKTAQMKKAVLTTMQHIDRWEQGEDRFNGGSTAAGDWLRWVTNAPNPEQKRKRQLVVQYVASTALAYKWLSYAKALAALEHPFAPRISPEWVKDAIQHFVERNWRPGL